MAPPCARRVAQIDPPGPPPTIDHVEFFTHWRTPLAPARGLARGAQSAVFGGGPSWMRSPMYAPINVNMTPMALMTT